LDAHTELARLALQPIGVLIGNGNGELIDEFVDLGEDCR
jgi:hypothetical protein